MFAVNAGPCAVPAHTLVFGRGEGAAAGQWLPCTMVAYDDAALQFRVQLAASASASASGSPSADAVLSVHRLCVLFDSEDPANFARRVANAHVSRRRFESYIRYSLYVDSMPIDEMQPLDNEQTARILASSLNSKSLKSNALGMACILLVLVP
jgi:hypothetical protein